MIDASLAGAGYQSAMASASGTSDTEDGRPGAGRVRGELRQPPEGQERAERAAERAAEEGAPGGWDRFGVVRAVGVERSGH
ncbi:hypothetical protein QMK19_09040 [Streptomyces sp. H10-C2]|uniref:hypothetical protein n=1 Tax=unclassified Streptomyces TaxID=2593676 RepID=UPI0024BB21A2|nr:MULTISPECIES: hypothetical protein [unclassified Streptomyces]MDJ0340949.1 hypothetical protein [Streptomyces sp. PH10-H1]MDJ0369819.1 hypothetical protein [Streptomyces sp. H10-C2]